MYIQASSLNIEQFSWGRKIQALYIYIEQVFMDSLYM